MRQQERTRLHTVELLEPNCWNATFSGAIPRLQRSKRLARSHVCTDKRLNGQSATRRSIPGIGPVTAFTLMAAYMPELGGNSPATMAALAGFTPSTPIAASTSASVISAAGESACAVAWLNISLCVPHAPLPEPEDGYHTRIGNWWRRSRNSRLSSPPCQPMAIDGFTLFCATMPENKRVRGSPIPREVYRVMRPHNTPA